MRLGMLSEKYESTGSGCVSNGQGDAGGVSYGCYQFSTDAGIPQAFTQWMLTNHYPFGEMLAAAGPAGEYQFTSTWQTIAENYPDEFAQLQHLYAQLLYFEPAVQALASIGLQILSRSNALMQVVWSRAIQYGHFWMPELFNSAAAMAGKEVSEMSDQELIWFVYEVNLTDPSWTSGSPSLRHGLFNRFMNERQEALALLESEGGTI